MNSQVIFKIDKALKQKAMQRAKLEGIPLAFVLKMATQAYANRKMDVAVVAEPKFNYKTDKEVKQALKDIKQGKNLSPGFTNAKDAIEYLDTLT
jgi:antitoxin component of RelBE/YafQ-DinJ toxin-antitoxin module